MARGAGTCDDGAADLDDPEKVRAFSEAQSRLSAAIIPLLRQVSAPVETFDAALKTLVDDMFETMYDAPGIGLAAIQVGVPLRVLVIDLQPEDPDAEPELCHSHGDHEHYHTPHKRELIAAKRSLTAVRRFLGVDSLHYLSLEGLLRAGARLSLLASKLGLGPSTDPAWVPLFVKAKGLVMEMVFLIFEDGTDAYFN